MPESFLSDPRFVNLLMNIGAGLLSQAGPRPISQGPPSIAAGLGQGLGGYQRNALQQQLVDSRLADAKLRRDEIERRRRQEETNAAAYSAFQNTIAGTPPGAAYDAGVFPAIGGLLNAPQPGLAPDSPEYRQALGGLLGTPYGSTALGLLSKQQTAPSGYAYNQGGLAPIPGGPADPRRQTLPPSGYAYGAGDRLAPVPGGPADPSRPAAPPSGYARSQGGLAPIPGGPSDPLRTQSPPSGYTYGAGGRLVPTPGGPADPAAKSKLTTSQLSNAAKTREARRNLTAALGIPPGPAFTQELQRRMISTDPITGLANVDYNSHIAKLAWQAAQPIPGGDPDLGLWQRQVTGLFPKGYKGSDSGKGGVVDMPRTSGGRIDKSKLMKGRTYRVKDPATGNPVTVKWNGRDFEEVR